MLLEIGIASEYDDRVRMDAFYIRNCSLWLDAYILLRTFKAVLTGEGAY